MTTDMTTDMSTDTELIRQLRGIDACDEAIEWARSLGDVTAQAAWDQCGDPEYMFHALGKAGGFGSADSDERKTITACAVEIASQVADMWTPDIKKAVAVVRRWTEGLATADEVTEAREKLWRYRRATAGTANAADAAYCTAAAAYYASDADAAAAAAARAVAADIQTTDQQTVAIIRRHYPVAPSLEVIDRAR